MDNGIESIKIEIKDIRSGIDQLNEEI